MSISNTPQNVISGDEKMIIKNSKNESGQSLVEGAIILPFLILLLTAVIEFGWVTFNRVNFDNMALVTVHANAKKDSSQAADYLVHYIRGNYSRFDNDSLTVTATAEVSRYYYDEYVWKPNQRKHWQVPMYFDVLRTKMEVSYELPYLTAMGKILFHDSDNKILLKTNAIASRALKNDTTASIGG